MDWRKLTIGQKNLFAFGVVLVLLVIISTISYFGAGNIVRNASEVVCGNKLEAVLAQKEIDHLNWTANVNALLTDASVTTLNVETDDHKCGFGKWLYGESRQEAERMVPSISENLKAIEKPHRELHASAIAIDEVFKKADVTLPLKLLEIQNAHLKWAGKVRDSLLKKNKSLEGVQTDPTQCILGKWINSEQAKNAYQNGSADFKKIWDTLPHHHDELHKSAVKINLLLAASQETKAFALFADETLPILEQTLGKLEGLKEEATRDLEGMEKANKIYASQTIPSLREVQAIIHNIRAEVARNMMGDDVMLAAAGSTQFNVSILGLFAVAAGVFLAFLNNKKIVVILKRVSSQLGDGAEQLTLAAEKISSSSQTLADGASEQAASVEETSASLEEMSSMTQLNSDNARQADNLMKESRQIIHEAEESMSKLTASMEEISDASAETQKIVKTIDEIAFQTNLLALNAAVEAARAGAAGAGFAVVADEVRNLAMRAAEAAKNTAALISGTVQKVKAGSELVTETSGSFNKASQTFDKIGTLVSEIATASSDQSQGIAQVNTAVSQIDSVAQNNASAAEEAAGASEQLKAEAAMINDTVNELRLLVGGAGETFGMNLFISPLSVATPTDELFSEGKKDTAILCWEIKKCPEDRRENCPAYPDYGSKCWMVTGTNCGGTKQGSYHKKIANCKKCEVYALTFNSGRTKGKAAFFSERGF